MSTPAAKRRRIDAAIALSKPFKSPFRTPSKPHPNSAATDTQNGASVSAEAAVTPGLPTATTLKARTSTPTKPNPYNLASEYVAHQTCSKTFHSSSTKAHPAILAIQERHRTLDRCILQARQDKDVLSQALKIAQSTQDEELEALVDKWRKAARAAAEEVFAGVKDKVNRMGGVGAWRERERQAEQWKRGWEQEDVTERRREVCGDQDDEEDENGGEDDRRRVEWERGSVMRWKDEGDIREDDGREETRAVEEGRDDDTFTMDMMLRTLNIELAVIGYDKERQMWIG